MNEFEIYAHVARPDENIEIIRERLGKPIFQDQKQKNEYRSIAKRASRTINLTFENRADGSARRYIKHTIDAFRKEGYRITPALISAGSSYLLAHVIRRHALHLLSNPEESKAYMGGIMDLVKGFHGVVDNFEPLNESYEPSLGKKRFRFIEDQAEFWSSPDRMNDGRIKFYEDPGLIKAGAKLAEKTYKRMYPIVERFLSSGR